MMIDPAAYPIPATGDCCAGDTVLFTEGVFRGSHRSPKFLGERRVAARIIKDSYGADKQQHTFSLEIIESDGVQPLGAGAKTTRKGRNVYRNGAWRQPWPDETLRAAAITEKHARGDGARSARETRRNEGGWR